MHGCGKMATFQNALFACPEGRSFNSYMPMSFRKAAEITIFNESKLKTVIYFDIDFTMGNDIGKTALYFHSTWRRENPTTPMKDYQILPGYPVGAVFWVRT